MLANQSTASSNASDALIRLSETSTDGLRKGILPPEFGEVQPELNGAVVMMVDDEPSTTDVVQMFLEEVGFENFVTCNDSTRAMESLVNERPDVLLLDLKMPGVSGFDVLAAMQTDRHLKHIPVIVLTSTADAETKLRVLELGAKDLLAKPVDPSELEMRLRNTLAAKAYQDQLIAYSASLKHQVRTRTAELEGAQRHIIRCLARAGEFRDNQTGKHVERVGRFAGIIAKRLGFDSDWVEMIEVAAQLHDIGKIGVSDTVLLKPGPLDPEEFELIKQHCEIGENIIRPWSQEARTQAEMDALAALARSPIIRMAAVIAETHHEKWDGSGYPRGLAGQDIPIAGRITSVADVYDALSSERPYKKALPLGECLDILRDSRGSHFDPLVLDAFLAEAAEIVTVQSELMD